MFDTCVRAKTKTKQKLRLHKTGKFEQMGPTITCDHSYGADFYMESGVGGFPEALVVRDFNEVPLRRPGEG